MYKSKEYQDNREKFKTIEADTIVNRIFKDKVIEFSTEFESFDCVYHERRSIIELKNRFFTSEWFDDKYKGEMLLEKGKCDRMLELVNNDERFLGYKACYLFYFKDDVYQYIVLNNINFDDLQVIKINCPTTSFIKDSPTILKECYILPTSLYTSKNFVRRRV
jgi:hypothetical protein